MEREWLVIEQSFDEYRVYGKDDVAKKMQHEVTIEVMVMGFVIRAYEYYLAVRSKREFTEDERAIGKALLLLLHEGMSRVGQTKGQA